ncbi:glucan endo-1,3-beta-glucosidase-like [Primulina huaijiensis]|uniref:glucan endo-1,3-beta-glucosidase-like n=1 Tax=Primulina huaijiensis TaxID=1492673 RepID=UPI003CC70240
MSTIRYSLSAAPVNCFFIFLLFLSGTLIFDRGEGAIGVCNGRLGSNLPSEQQVVEFYRANGIQRMRIYEPNQATLRALQGSGIELMLGVPNVDLQSLQSDATDWVRTNVVPHFPNTRIRYIAVGNEVDPENPETSRFVPLVLPAMRNIYDALSVFNLQDRIKISTATFSALLMNTSSPSSSSFRNMSFMEPIVRFLEQTDAPLLANIYPYFAHIGDTRNVPLPYALFTAPGIVVQDGVYGYRNLFDAMLDSMYYATERAGGPNVEIVVSESGWPSDGGVAANMANADAYYRNLVNHVGNGTPRRPGNEIETYLFAMFDENQKPGAQSEQHFGLFHPNMQIKYQVDF